jgi:hypothetical protein
MSARHNKPALSRGTASVEFALILPLLLVLLAVIVDGGRMLADYHAVTKSVRDAARFLAHSSAEPQTCIPGNLDRGQTQVADAIRLAMTGRVGGDPAAEGLVPGWAASDLSEAATGVALVRECFGANGTGLYAGRTAITSIAVHASVPFRFTLARVFGLEPNLTLRVSHRAAATRLEPSA